MSLYATDQQSLEAAVTKALLRDAKERNLRAGGSEKLPTHETTYIMRAPINPKIRIVTTDLHAFNEAVKAVHRMYPKMQLVLLERVTPIIQVEDLMPTFTLRG